MIPELAKDPYANKAKLLQVGMRKIIGYLTARIKKDGPILDIAQRSPLTDLIEQEYGPVYNTSGDLDVDFEIPVKYARYIVYSHTIEHQFNPLYTLLRLREVMDENSRMFIILPSRGKLLWEEQHFHEIDHYRMQLLFKRAGLKMVSFERKKVWRSPLFYFQGVRPVLRFFLEYTGYYEVIKDHS
jgi:hypothetical protein